MRQMIALLIGASAWIVLLATAAQAEDGCGRGRYDDGRGCVPQDEDGSRYHEPRHQRAPRDYEPPAEYEYREPPTRRHYGPPPQAYEPQPRYYEPETAGSPFRLGREEPQYQPPNPAFRTWNNCPPNFTVQDGLCKPYTGR